MFPYRFAYNHADSNQLVITAFVYPFFAELYFSPDQSSGLPFAGRGAIGMQEIAAFRTPDGFMLKKNDTEQCI